MPHGIIRQYGPSGTVTFGRAQLCCWMLLCCLFFPGGIYAQVEPCLDGNCIKCPQGHKTVEFGRCEPCGANYYQPCEGQDFCSPCPEGTTSPPGSATCDADRAGNEEYMRPMTLYSNGTRLCVSWDSQTMQGQDNRILYWRLSWALEAPVVDLQDSQHLFSEITSGKRGFVDSENNPVKYVYIENQELPVQRFCIADPPDIEKSVYEKTFVVGLEALIQQANEAYTPLNDQLEFTDEPRLSVAVYTEKWETTEDCTSSYLYLDNWGDDVYKWKCEACPEGAYCEGELTRSEIKAKFGWYRLSLYDADIEPSDVPQFFPCLNPEACLGGENKVFYTLSDEAKKDQAEQCNQAAGHKQYCTAVIEGNITARCRLCRACILGYWPKGIGDCEVCPPPPSYSSSLHPSLAWHCCPWYTCSCALPWTATHRHTHTWPNRCRKLFSIMCSSSVSLPTSR